MNQRTWIFLASSRVLRMILYLFMAREAVVLVAELMAKPSPAPFLPCGPSKGGHHPGWALGGTSRERRV